MAKVLTYATNNPGCHMHGNLPCAAWSQLQQLNIFQHGEPFAAKLRLAQKASLKLVQKFIVVAKSTVGRFHSYNKGWKERIVQQMLQVFELCRSALIDGCIVGVVSSKW